LDATSDLSNAIEFTKHEIDLTREYRTRLISDVVTGKINVRELSRLSEGEGDIDVIADEVEAIDEVIGTNADEAELVEEVADADD
jgi:type I restriction enzyme S subunit